MVKANDQKDGRARRWKESGSLNAAGAGQGQIAHVREHLTESHTLIQATISLGLFVVKA